MPLSQRIRSYLSMLLVSLLVSITGGLSNAIARRQAVVTLITGASTVPFSSWAEEDFQSRDRKGNRDAIIRDDYWYISGKTPPRLLGGPLKGDDPDFNAFGSCITGDDGSNSCTYVSLKQRIPAYSKYASSVAYGAQQYQRLQPLLKEPNWLQAEALLRTEEKTPPPPSVDAELKMVLLATALLTSPNFPGPSRELLVARYYANEVRFCHREILTAIDERDSERALEAWEYGRDAWNSYFQTIDRQIVPKVGDKFTPII